MATQADYDKLGSWAVIFNDDRNIDRHGQGRAVPMEVLSLGFSRTGTLSVQEALQTLGYPTYHYSSVFANVKDADIWMEALDAKFNSGKGGSCLSKTMFDQVLGEYGAVTDTPAVLFWKEMIEAYPEAKVILVERDEQKWAKSIGVLFDGILHPVGTYVLRFTDPFWFGRINQCGRDWIKAFTGSLSLLRAKENAVAAYRRHNGNIKAAVPKERLLVYDLASGWEPLCKFLGKDIPQTPFPHRNEAATIEKWFIVVLTKAFKNSLFNLAIVAGVGSCVGAIAWKYAS